MKRTLEMPAGYASVPQGPHCGVLAVAIAAKCRFEDAWDCIKRQSGRGGDWKGRTYSYERTKALKALGARFHHREHVTASWYRANKGGLGDRYRARCSVLTFAKKHAKPDTVYVLGIRGHSFTLCNGMCADQGGVVPVERFFRATSIVFESIEIE